MKQQKLDPVLFLDQWWQHVDEILMKGSIFSKTIILMFSVFYFSAAFQE